MLQIARVLGIDFTPRRAEAAPEPLAPPPGAPSIADLTAGLAPRPGEDTAALSTQILARLPIGARDERQRP